MPARRMRICAPGERGQLVSATGNICRRAIYQALIMLLRMA